MKTIIALVLAISLAGCSVAEKIEAKVCGFVPGYGRVCAYWKDGKIVLEAEVTIPEDRVGEVLEGLGIK